ncbi:sigma-54-dependent Fis family transcriptional regulator [Virgibacillus alimentarius]|uniref:sigma-54-dependent Fis family transcriptional regulator n=1 Tax=Virgibacillus alimentarius TaxID=698769 RepID=UPI000493474F|nr:MULTISPECIES: sigma-54-dependent Fis family transcriptional regulator [Virgibacillus]HLR67949.1 sigma-54-dependent Fis family transcriptional regulator [Virgibacillus sp.]
MSNFMNENLKGSWKRSEQYGACILKAKEAILEDKELRQHKEKGEKLLRTVHPTIEQLAHSLKSSNSVVVISNPSGILLHSMGDPAFLKDTEKIYLKDGACWSEQVRGTNSAGTVAMEQKPLAVIGKDHYLKSHHMLYCVGSPIFDPYGNLQAVLNVSGHADLYHPMTFGMVDVIARKIENWLLVRTQEEKMIISLYPEEKGIFEALIAINKHGQIIGVNREARTLLSLEKQGGKEMNINDIFKRPERIFDESVNGDGKMIQIESKNHKKLLASVVNSSPKLFSMNQSNKVEKRYAQPKINKRFTFSNIHGEDEHFVHALSLAKRVAETDYTVVVTGESGTGKEMVSQAIHEASSRSAQPFVALNCGAITKSLAGSELFGYEGGAFTGAKQKGQAGVFEQANGGTLFLDEIAELPMDIQITLLRVLQDFQIKRIGSTKSIAVDVRLITATNKDLWKKVEEGSFRADLFFRLQGIHIQLPPFRKRSDRLQFAKMKLMEVARELGRPQLSFSKDAENFIETYDWPGNIRQVSHALRQAAFASPTSRIEVNAFPPYMKNCNKTISQTGSLLQDRENETIIQTITKTKGNMSEAARILGIGRNTLYRKIESMRKNNIQIDYK